MMVYEFDKWNPEMLIAVENELQTRNILPLDLEDQKRLAIETEKNNLELGKQAGLTIQVLGWLTVFGFLGICIGYHHAFSKVKSKYNSRLYYKYNSSSRENGNYLFYTSIFLTGLGLVYRYIIKDS